MKKGHQYATGSCTGPCPIWVQPNHGGMSPRQRKDRRERWEAGYGPPKPTIKRRPAQ